MGLCSLKGDNMKEDIKDYIERYPTYLESLDQIDQLKQQLEEAQTRINELEDKDWFEATIKQLEEQNNRLIQERDNLKQQLAEKDKELIYMTKQAKKFNNEAQKYYEDAYCNGLQNQKAIAELEKVKDWLNEPFDEDGCFKIGGDLIDFIEQQIKELKGEKDVED